MVMRKVMVAVLATGLMAGNVSAMERGNLLPQNNENNAPQSLSNLFQSALNDAGMGALFASIVQELKQICAFLFANNPSYRNAFATKTVYNALLIGMAVGLGVGCAARLEDVNYRPTDAAKIIFVCTVVCMAITILDRLPSILLG